MSKTIKVKLYGSEIGMYHNMRRQGVSKRKAYKLATRYR